MTVEPMDDSQIVKLYHLRNEQAITESSRKYGPLCRRIAINILSNTEDAKECVNDTWFAAWRRMPPDHPYALGAFLGRITRNLSISRWRADHAKKRYRGMELLLSELEDCIPAPADVEQIIEQRELTRLLDQWLDALPEPDCILFVRRYWYGDAVHVLAKERRRTPNQISQQLLRLRKKLKFFLEQEGVCL